MAIAETDDGSHVIVWEGEVYTRPVGRGVSLNPLSGVPDEGYLEDLIETVVPEYHYADVKITVAVTNLRHQDDEPQSHSYKARQP